MMPAAKSPNPKPASRGDEIRSQLGHAWLGQIYGERVLKLRTRSYHFGALPKRARVEIQHTLLGVELKVGRRRFLCPDLATARYLSVFAHIGCEAIAIPYDITQLSRLADELESSWQRMLLLIEHEVPEALRARTKALLVARVRAEISNAGPGEKMPEFKQSTRQRRSDHEL
jgi:hypothetical protein